MFFFFCKSVFTQNTSDCITLYSLKDGGVKTDLVITVQEHNGINNYVYNSNPFLLGSSKERRNRKRLQKTKRFAACLSNNFNYYVVANEGGCSRQQWLITDRDIIINNLLCNFPDSIQEKIVYSYSDGRDSAFQNLIDFEHKIVLSENIYYYPLRDSLISYIVLVSVQYTNQEKCLESLLKKKGLLDKVPIREDYSINIFIPILQANNEKKSK